MDRSTFTRPNATAVDPMIRTSTSVFVLLGTLLCKAFIWCPVLRFERLCRVDNLWSAYAEAEYRHFFFY
jgi:hypothetical protein